MEADTQCDIRKLFKKTMSVKTKSKREKAIKDLKHDEDYLAEVFSLPSTTRIVQVTNFKCTKRIQFFFRQYFH